MNIGFLGFGNIGVAIAQGLLKTNAMQANQLYAVAKNKAKLQYKCTQLNITPCHSINELIEKTDAIIIAVKPYQIEPILTPIKNLLNNKIIISVAAGMLFEQYEKILNSETKHISILPNTPVSIGNGIIIAEKKHNLNKDEFENIKTIFGKIALFESVPSNLFGIAGTLSGCAPAYTAIFIEALGDAGVKHGLPRTMAYKLAAKMMEGTASLQLETGDHPAKMKDNVCSPAGTTIKGLIALEEKGFRSSIITAIQKAME